MAKSKNILITGASTGIGFDLAKVFVEDGYTVFGSVRKKKDAERLSDTLGENFKPLLFDVTDDEAVDKAAKKLEKEIGEEGLGGLINNAGIAVGGPLMDVTMEEFRYQFEVNVLGVVKVTKAFLPLLGAREDHPADPGRIVQISSVAGKMPMAFLSPYVGSKHALEGISHCLRRELMLFGIDVIIVGPGAVKTPIWNKGASEEDEVRYKDSPFKESLYIFRKVFIKSAIKNGWSPERLASVIKRAFERPKPRLRYALVAQRFKNWTLPRLLTDRMLDRLIGKSLKLIKK